MKLRKPRRSPDLELIRNRLWFKEMIFINFLNQKYKIIDINGKIYCYDEENDDWYSFNPQYKEEINNKYKEWLINQEIKKMLK